MKRRFLGISIVATISTLFFVSSVHAQNKVTLSSVARPVRLVAEDIARQANVRIMVDPSLAERKLVCLVKEMSVDDLLTNIARVLGGECKVSQNAQTVSYTLSPQPEVRVYVKAYDINRTAAKKAAVEHFAHSIRNNLQSRLAKMNADQPKEVRTLYSTENSILLSQYIPDSAWYQLASAMASGIPDASGTLQVTGQYPIYRCSYSELNQGGKQLLEQVVNQLPGTYKRHFGPVSESSIALFFSQGLPCVGFNRVTPDGIFVGGYPHALPSVEVPTEEQRNQWEDLEMSRRMASRPLPPEAVLGFTVGQNGSCDAPLKLGGKLLQGVLPAPKTAPKREELLNRIFTVDKLNVIADYYTDDARLGNKKQQNPSYNPAPYERPHISEFVHSNETADAVLKIAAKRFNTVFMVKDGTLLARYTDFAKRNYTEAKYPVFEQCITARGEQGRSVQYLPLHLLLMACDLPSEQFLHLCRYNDTFNSVSFSDLGSLSRVKNSGFPEHIRLGMLNRLSYDALLSTGVPWESLSTPLQDLLRYDAMVREGLNAQPMPPNAQLRVSLQRSRGSGEDAIPAYWQLKLVWPDNSRQSVFIQQIPASLPTATIPTQKTTPPE